MPHDPEVRPRAQRRQFSADEKVQILAQYDAARTPLERAELARKTGVYSSLIANWRKQLREPTVQARKRGRPANLEAVEIRKLREENARLQRRLEKSERTVAALGKAHALLQMIASESAWDESTSSKS